MRFRHLPVYFAASAALAQQPATPPAATDSTPTQPAAAHALAPANTQISPNERFYKNFQITPMGAGKVLIVMDDGIRKYNALGAEPVTPKDGGEVTQWTLFENGFVTLYSKKTIVIPNPNGGEGTPIEGISVTNLSQPSAASPAAPGGHQSSSKYTTPPRKSADFKIPLRFEKRGLGMGQPVLWLRWDGKNEIRVDPVDTKFGDTWRTLPGFGNHLKFLANVYTEGHQAPRYFYLKQNGDESFTIYGDDDIDKLKAIEKAKDK